MNNFIFQPEIIFFGRLGVTLIPGFKPGRLGAGQNNYNVREINQKDAGQCARLRFCDISIDVYFLNRCLRVCAPIVPTKIPPFKRSSAPLSAMVHKYRVHGASSRSKNEGNVFQSLHTVPPIGSFFFCICKVCIRMERD